MASAMPALLLRSARSAAAAAAASATSRPAATLASRSACASVLSSVHPPATFSPSPSPFCLPSSLFHPHLPSPPASPSPSPSPSSAVPVFSLHLSPPSPSPSTSTSTSTSSSVANGDLLPSTFVFSLLRAHLSALPAPSPRCVLDGFPRTADQVSQLLTLSPATDILVLDLCADDAAARARIAHRASSSLSSITTSSTSTCPPTRADDVSAPAVEHRLATFRAEAPAVRAALAARGVPAVAVDASGSRDAMVRACVDAVAARGAGVKNVVLTGPPGVGKGTVGKALADAFAPLVHVSTGDLVRESLAGETAAAVEHARRDEGIAEEEEMLTQFVGFA